MTPQLLGLFVIGGIGVLLVLDIVSVLLFGPDPDLEAAARGGWSPETSCGNPGCRSHRLDQR